MREPAFCICENKEADQLRGNRETDQRLCFRYIDSSITLLSKYEISSLVCIGPGRKPRSPVFSQRGSNNLFLDKTGVNGNPKCTELICLVFGIM